MYKLIIISLLLLTNINADIAEGEEMYKEGSCSECHNVEDFMPSQLAKAKNFHQIESKVIACQMENNDELFDDESHSVAQYLNHKFYKFKEK